MKLIHLSDLHLGKVVNGFSMLDDQKYILKQIVKIIDEESPDAILIAGDVYDRSVPSAEAVTLLDDFLGQLAERKLETFLISGNHDSPERNAFASKLIDQSGIHISPVFRGEVKPHIFYDGDGEVAVYMLPFLKPITVSAVYPEEKDQIKSYTDAMRVALNHLDIDSSRRNVLVTHQFVTGAARSDSEEKSLGGADNIDPDVFDAFDYVALGHIHRPQTITEKIRYSGSPLKYSFSEIDYDKSVTIVELEQKGKREIRTAPLLPLHDMKQIRGTFNELVDKSFYDGLNREDYYRVILTDENDVFEALSKLRVIYPNIMGLEYDNARTKATSETLKEVSIDDVSPLDIFADFYEKQNGRKLDETPYKYVTEQIEKIWEEK